MIKTITYLLAVCLFAIFMLSIAIFCLLPSENGLQVTAHGGAITFIPTVKQQQIFLQSKGFDLGPYGVDGKLGDPSSFTQKALKTYYWNKRADELYVPIKE